jgi:hypothetical protein
MNLQTGVRLQLADKKKKKKMPEEKEKKMPGK